MSKDNNLQQTKKKWDYTRHFEGVVCPNCFIFSKFEQLPTFTYTAGETVKCPRCDHSFIVDDNLE